MSLTSPLTNEKYWSWTSTRSWFGIWEWVVYMTLEFSFNSAILWTWGREEKTWARVRPPAVVWPQALRSGFGWGSETRPRTWERMWITGQIFFEHLPCPGKQQLDRGEGGLGLEFQWSGFHPKLSTYHLHDIGQFMSLIGLSFLSQMVWMYILYQEMVGVMYIHDDGTSWLLEGKLGRPVSHLLISRWSEESQEGRAIKCALFSMENLESRDYSCRSRWERLGEVTSCSYQVQELGSHSHLTAACALSTAAHRSGTGGVEESGRE